MDNLTIVFIPLDYIFPPSKSTIVYHYETSHNYFQLNIFLRNCLMKYNNKHVAINLFLPHDTILPLETLQVIIGKQAYNINTTIIPKHIETPYIQFFQSRLVHTPFLLADVDNYSISELLYDYYYKIKYTFASK